MDRRVKLTFNLLVPARDAGAEKTTTAAPLAYYLARARGGFSEDAHHLQEPSQGVRRRRGRRRRRGSQLSETRARAAAAAPPRQRRAKHLYEIARRYGGAQSETQTRAREKVYSARASFKRLSAPCVHPQQCAFREEKRCARVIRELETCCAASFRGDYMHFARYSSDV